MTDYGYGDAEPDYGYGDAAPTEDYGYGDAAPDQPDYGYGDTAAPSEDYGYGDAAPSEDMGYGDAAPAAAPKENRRPKRRCSVTKFSLEESKGSAEQEMVQQLNAAQMLENFRNGKGLEQPASTPTEAPRTPPAPTDSGYSTDGKSTETVMTSDSSDEADPAEPAAKSATATKTKSKGAMAKLRKRLSIFN